MGGAPGPPGPGGGATAVMRPDAGGGTVATFEFIVLGGADIAGSPVLGGGSKLLLAAVVVMVIWLMCCCCPEAPGPVATEFCCPAAAEVADRGKGSPGAP